MVYHEAPPASAMRLIQVIFKARSMISKSIIFKPPCFFSAIIVFLLIFGGLPSQINLKIILLIVSISGFEIVKSEVLYISLSRPRVLTMFILPMSVRFLLFQLCRVCSKLYTFSSKLSLLTSTGSYEK